jgi:hypothetical protein
MRSWKSFGTIGLATVLAASIGCTVSVQPWTKPHPAVPAQELPPGSPPAAFKAPMPGPYPNYPPNGVAPNGYPPYPYPPNPSAANESTSQLIKQLNEMDDQRKAFQDQAQALKKQLRERDDNLQHASYEMEESSKQLKRTREEVRQFSGELDDLRDRMRKLEEMRTALKPLIDEIMFHLEREKESPKVPRAPGSNK